MKSLNRLMARDKSVRKIILFFAFVTISLRNEGQITYRSIDLDVGNRLSVKADASSIVVPENRTTKNGKVELAFVRLSCTSNARSFPIVWLSGGPGVPGIASAREDMYAVLNALREVGDVILLDQRGTGQSKPSLHYEGDRFSLPPHKAINDEASERKLIAHLQVWQQQLASKGIDISSYNTNESVEDLEDLRLALNVEKLNLFAHSYGTHLALAYVKKYGNRVNRMVLGGVNGLDQRYRMPEQGDELVQLIDSMVQQEPGMRKLIPDFRSQLHQLINKLNENPVSVRQFSGADRMNGSLLINGFDLQVTLAVMSGDTSFPMDLPAMLYNMEKGHFNTMAAYVYNAVKNRDYPTAMSFAMHCASGVAASKRRIIEAQATTAVLGNAINYPFSLSSFCETLGIVDLGDEFRMPFKSDVPVLMVSGSLDGRTSAKDAELVRQNFSKSSHIIIEGSAHQVFSASPAVVKMSIDFLGGVEFMDSKLQMPTFGFRSPLDAQYQENVSKIYNKSGITAVESYLTTLIENDEYVGFWLLNGLALRWQQMGKTNEPLELMLLNAKIFPAYYMNYRYIAQLYARMGNSTKADEFYSRALELNPYDFGSLAGLGMLK